MTESKYIQVATLVVSSLLVTVQPQRGLLLAQSDNKVKSSVRVRSMRQSPKTNSSSATQTAVPQLVVNGQIVSGKLKYVDGRYYVGVEELARSLHGSARYQGEQIVLTLPLPSAHSETLPPVSPRTGTGRIKGTLTYYFDEHYGTQPDTGSEVWLVEGHQEIASDATLSGLADKVVFTLDGDQKEYKVVKHTIADDKGDYKLADVSAGQYTLIFQSKHTRGPIDSGRERATTRDYNGRFVTFKLTLRPGWTIERSFDFGISSF